MLAICPDCGFPVDGLNESQRVCPRCGADLGDAADADVSLDVLLDLADTPSIEARAAPAADESVDASEELPGDPDLDLLLQDAEALADSVAAAPVFVRGSSRIQ